MNVYDKIGGAPAVDAAVAMHLQKTHEELSVPSDLVSEIITVAASTRGDVLNR